MDRITCHELPELFQGAADIFGEKKEELCEMDARMGDGESLIIYHVLFYLLFCIMIIHFQRIHFRVRNPANFLIFQFIIPLHGRQTQR